MKKKHDERKVINQLIRDWEADVNFGKKVVLTPKNAPLSIHMCGKLDFLIHYCGWRHGYYTKDKEGKRYEMA